MAIKAGARSALIDTVGVFDPAFGHGYGEENDLCLRAARAGWRNVLADNAFGNFETLLVRVTLSPA